MPGTLSHAPARVQARVDACQNLFRTSSRVGRAAAGILGWRRWIAGAHHLRLASNRKPSCSQRALRELEAGNKPST
eukprot:9458154-Pyramimonas_sp.AAC.1